MDDEFLSGPLGDLETNATLAARGVTECNQALKKNEEEHRRTASSVEISSRKISKHLSTAFSDLVVDGDRLSDVMRRLGLSIADTAFRAAIKPVADTIGGGIAGVLNGVLGFADGGAFSQGKVMPFARGGVVSSPVAFPMRGGTGLMGEAGPEAIMPLSRGPDGKLGVRAAGGGQPVNVVMNIQTPDAEGFRRSQSQIAAQMNRMLARGQRNR